MLALSGVLKQFNCPSPCRTNERTRLQPLRFCVERQVLWSCPRKGDQRHQLDKTCEWLEGPKAEVVFFWGMRIGSAARSPTSIRSRLGNPRKAQTLEVAVPCRCFFDGRILEPWQALVKPKQRIGHPSSWKTRRRSDVWAWKILQANCLLYIFGCSHEKIFNDIQYMLWIFFSYAMFRRMTRIWAKMVQWLSSCRFKRSFWSITYCCCNGIVKFRVLAVWRLLSLLSECRIWSA